MHFTSDNRVNRPPFINISLDLNLISLNKYVVTLIIEQANSCLTYNFTGLWPTLPFIEKILLLVRPI